jgi:hypothetical protein
MASARGPLNPESSFYDRRLSPPRLNTAGGGRSGYPGYAEFVPVGESDDEQREEVDACPSA